MCVFSIRVYVEHACVYIHACLGEYSPPAPPHVNLTGNIVEVPIFSQLLWPAVFPLSLSRSSRLSLSTSVPVLVLVVPAVEVYVERHDAAGRHASDQSPAGRTQQQDGRARGEGRSAEHTEESINALRTSANMWVHSSWSPPGALETPFNQVEVFPILY